jgi:predicted O-methyltransferase YrrM
VSSWRRDRAKRRERDKTTAETIQKAFGFIGADELEALKRYAGMLPPNPTVINIGAGPGTSGLAFLESREDLSLVTIDIQDESSPHGSLDSERRVIKESGISVTARWTQIHGDSKFAYWPKPLDMVFIDGDHSYEGCKGDIETWLPRLKVGGILFIHDYHFDTVKKAVDELLASERVEHVENVLNSIVMRKK